MLTENEKHSIGRALEEGKIDKQFVIIRTNAQLREYLEKSEVEVNSKTDYDNT